MDDLKAVIKQVIRWWRGQGFSMPKALAITVVALILLALFGATLTWLILGVLGSSFLSAIDEYSAKGMSYQVIWKFAWAMAMTFFFLFTVGIPLMIDEARNWFTRILLGAVILGVAAKIITIFAPITDGHPTASAVLVVAVLLFGVEAIARMLRNTGDKASSSNTNTTSGFSWFARILATVFVLWLIFTGVTNHFGWGKKDPAKESARSSAAVSAPSPQPTYTNVSIITGEEETLSAAEVLPGCSRYGVNVELASGRVKVFQDDKLLCEDFPSNPDFCTVDPAKPVRFVSISEEEVRFKFKVACAK